LCEPGSFYSPPPSPEGRHEYLVWLALNKPHIYGRLLARTLPRKRGRSQREHSMREPDPPFRSEEEYEQACREAGIPCVPVYSRVEYEPVPQDDVQVSPNQEVKKPA
jgi:hypothetical protein